MNTLTLSNGTVIEAARNPYDYTHAVVSVATEETIAATQRNLDEWLSTDLSAFSDRAIKRFNKRTAWKRAHLDRLVVGRAFYVVTWMESKEKAEEACLRALADEQRPGRSITWGYKVLTVDLNGIAHVNS